MTIIVDPNEAANFKGMKYFGQYDVPFKIHNTVTGIWDFCIRGRKEYDGRVIEKNILIERKTWFDFLRSADSRDNHLIQQLKRLSAVSKQSTDDRRIVPVLLIEGSMAAVLNSRYAKRWPEGRIIPFKAGLFAGWSNTIRFYETTSSRRTVFHLKAMDDSINREVKEDLPYAISDPGPVRSIDDEAFNMILAKPKIGGKRCKALFEMFGTVKNIVNQSEESLKDAIGPTLGKALYEVVNMQPEI